MLFNANTQLIYRTLLSFCLLSITEGGRKIINTRIGEDIELKCQKTDGVLYTWYKDDRVLTEHSDLQIREDVLKITNLKPIDEGLYSCQAISGYGPQAWKNISLFVYDADTVTFPENPVLRIVTSATAVAPRFIENPPGKREPTLHVATSAKLRCRVQPDANAEISWYKDDHPLDFQRENIVKEGFGIKFNHLKMADKGRYMCIVSNSQGSVNFTYYVTVTDVNTPAATVVVPYPQNTSVMYGSSASLQCKVRSYSRPSITWLKEVTSPTSKASLQLNGKRYILIKNETMMVETEEGAYLNKLLLVNVKMEDAGVYVCLGMNPRGGSDYREALVTVIQPSVMATTTVYPSAKDNSWEYMFGSPSATLAVLIAIPTIFIVIVTAAIAVAVNKRNKNTGTQQRRRPSNMLSDHEVAVPLNMNANNGSYTGQHTSSRGSNGSYNKVPYNNGEYRHVAEKHRTPSYSKSPPLQYSQYLQSDGSCRSTLQYQPVGLMKPIPNYMIDAGDSDSQFSSVSHTRPQYMNSSRNPYDDRDIHSDPAASRVGGHHCPPPPPGSYYSGQW